MRLQNRKRSRKYVTTQMAAKTPGIKLHAVFSKNKLKNDFKAKIIVKEVVKILIEFLRDYF